MPDTIPQPAVSIVLPTYDRLALLREAVESVLAQTLSDWELIVVDDGSTDDSVAWVQSIGDPRIIVVSCPHTGNRSRLRNLGVARGRAPWIAFLDSDDLWAPEKLEIQLNRLTHTSNCRWSCTGVRFIDGNGSPMAQRSGATHPTPSGWILEQLLMFTAAATMPTLMVHRSLIEEVGGFDETFLLREDYEFELRLAARSEIHALPEAFTVVRHHAGRTSSSRRLADLLRGTEMVFRKVALENSDPRIRTICRRQCAVQLVSQARSLSIEGGHLTAMVLSGRALKEAPFMRDAWRSAAACVLRWLGWKQDKTDPRSY